MQTEQVVKRVQESAAKRADDRPVNLASMPVGYHFWQGDVCLQRLAKVPDGFKAVEASGEIQLAPGTSLGSQHRVDAKSVALYKGDDRVLFGNVLQVGPSGATVTHPKHGHCLLPADSVFGVGYQRAYSPLGEILRQKD